MTDLVFLSVPYTASYSAPAAPAILKSVIKKHGYSSSYLDMNIDVLRSNEYNESVFRDFSVSNKVKDKNVLLYWCQKYVDKIKALNPKFVGISVFTYNCLPVTKLMCLMIRTQLPNVQIILGGQGLGQNGINSEINAGAALYNLDLCDYWVKSEGEQVLLEILAKGRKNKKSNKDIWTQITDLDTVPTPDYDDHVFSLYKPEIPVTHSRGCIRRCTFCDIHTHWKKFVFRDGKKVADEMAFQADRYGINDFLFTDSLLNGSMKAYRDLIQRLTEHNDKREQKIQWTSQFIFRPVQQMSDFDWKLTKTSGAKLLNVGIESFSEEIRDHMLKKFSNQDIIDNLQIMKKYGLQSQLLLIVGYVIESQNHIDEAKEMLIKLKPFAGNAIQKLQFGATLSILPGTPLEKMYGDTILRGTNENDWVNVETGSTLPVRLQWLQELKAHAKDCGFNVMDDNVHQSFLENLVSEDVG